MNRFRKPCHFIALTALMCLVCTGLSSPAMAARSLLLATTTSVQDSGLLEVLIPLFEKESGYLVKTVAVGSGDAMKMGGRGEVDVLLVHSPEAVNKFVAEGNGSESRPVMHNEFVLVGPASDPAKVRDSRTVAEALRKIASSGKALFLSRQDNSGTHVREMELWKAAGVSPVGHSWYQHTTGLGMGQTLFVADERKGYTLTDYATFWAQKKKLDLVILLKGVPGLRNSYQVVVVNATRWPRVNESGARRFADFLVNPATQKVISEFGVDLFGQPLFVPDAGGTPGRHD